MTRLLLSLQYGWMRMEEEWDELRKEARKIEGDLDVRLSSYAKLGASGYSDSRLSTESNGGEMPWKSLEVEIESLLEKLLHVNDAMVRCASASVPTTSISQKLTRHCDILHEFTQEFKRTRGNIISMREHADLLTSVRNDINEYKVSGSSLSVPNLLRERAAIHGSITQIDEVTEQAEVMKGVLAAQRNAFTDIQGKVKQLSDRFPVIRGLLVVKVPFRDEVMVLPSQQNVAYDLLGRSSSQGPSNGRNQKTLILSAVIVGCTLFLIVYWFSK